MNNPLDYSGKVALVTGAAAGMGLATARAFAEAGAAVVLADFKEDAVTAAADKLSAAGHKAIAMRCDVSNDDEVAAMVDRTVAEFGRLDAAFNNAGVMAQITPIAESSRAEWDRVIGINLRGVWSCMQHELRQMERQRSGAIVNNASVGALTGNAGIASYIASKHGVIGLTRTAALECVKHGIRVNAVNPGLIDTPVGRDVFKGDEQMYSDTAKNVPIGRAGRPEEIASVVLWLCSPGASYVVGHGLTVDGGMTVACFNPSCPTYHYANRRTFLKATGAAALAFPAILRAQPTAAETRKLNMEIKRIGSQPSVRGPADWFTGTVRIDPLFEPNASARAGAATVTFEPGARTAWHTHPLGQRLIVTAGAGRAGGR